MGKNYVLDVGIHRQEIDNEEHSDFWYKSQISDQGDLSTYYGYETFNAKGYTIREGKVFHQVLDSPAKMNEASAFNLLDEGYAYVRIKDLPKEMVSSPFPINLVSENYEQPDFRLGVGVNPSFFLVKNDEIRFAVINGFLIDLGSTGEHGCKNGLVLR